MGAWQTAHRAVALAAALSFTGLTAGCIYLPSPLAGVPADQNWIALPLSGWIAEGETRVRALSFCARGDCPVGTVVAALDLTGQAAVEIEQALTRPSAIAAIIDAARRRRAPAAKNPSPPQIVTRPVRIGARDAVAVDVVRHDGTRSASAIISARRHGSHVRAVLIVAPDADAAFGTAHDVLAADR